MDEREELIQRLSAARERIRALLPRVDPRKQIYPNWTLHQFLAHMTGWDDAVISSLRAHLEGREPATPAVMGIDAYNAETINTRETVDLNKVTAEWERTRVMLIDLLRAMPEEKWRQQMIVPWGEPATVPQLIRVFIHHEEKEHGPDLEEWLQHPDQPLLGRH